MVKKKNRKEKPFEINRRRQAEIALEKEWALRQAKKLKTQQNGSGDGDQPPQFIPIPADIAYKVPGSFANLEETKRWEEAVGRKMEEMQESKRAKEPEIDPETGELMPMSNKQKRRFERNEQRKLKKERRRAEREGRPIPGAADAQPSTDSQIVDAGLAEREEGVGEAAGTDQEGADFIRVPGPSVGPAEEASKTKKSKEPEKEGKKKKKRKRDGEDEPPAALPPEPREEVVIEPTNPSIGQERDVREKKGSKKEESEDKPKKRKRDIADEPEHAVSEIEQVDGKASKKKTSEEAKKERKSKKPKRSGAQIDDHAEAQTDELSHVIDGEHNDALQDAGQRFIVFIGNLPFSATKESITEHFKKIQPFDVRLLTHKDTGKLKGFAFLEFEGYDKMKSCLKLYHHSTFGDGKNARRINVELTYVHDRNLIFKIHISVLFANVSPYLALVVAERVRLESPNCRGRMRN